MGRTWGIYIDKPKTAAQKTELADKIAESNYHEPFAAAVKAFGNKTPYIDTPGRV